jgi:hypothetical protein
MKTDYYLPRVDSISIEEFRTSYLLPQKPCIISGLARWPAHAVWDRDYLRRAYGDTLVRASQSVNHIHPDLSHAPAPPPTIRIRFADYVDLVCSGASAAKNLFVIGDNIPIFSAEQSSTNGVSPLQKDVEIPALVNRARLHYIGFWLSAQGTESRMHYDANGCHNLNVQVRGRKQVVMCSPDRCDLLYPYSRTMLNDNFGQFSQVNAFEPELDRFPLFSDAVRWIGTLETGDALFIPAYWYHAFRHDGGLNINVNFWWHPDVQFLNGVTAREVLIAALAKQLRNGNDVRSLAPKLAELDRDTIRLMHCLELALLSPSLPGRSERL